MDFTKTDYINNIEAEIISLGVCRNLNANQIRKIAEMVVNDNPNADYNIIIGIALREAIEINDEKKSMPKTLKQKPIEEGLIEIHLNNENSNAELLREKGYIKENDDLLAENF
jgi:DNA primase catalytic subunit